ncbi:MAG: hypothetical protein C4547_02700 [Phycisphaerales bacterium]|nr:MAG: hypothetical protein C4547_02700 [Phycisphaerales bacterium]
MSDSQIRHPHGANGRNRRRLRVINPAFQWKYTLTVVGGVFMIYTLMSCTLFGILHQQARRRVLFPDVTSVWENTLVMIVCAAVFAVVMAAGLCLWSLVVTHRICGPLYVMERMLTHVAEGRRPDRRPLRRHDELKDFYALMWRALDRMEQREDAYRQSLRRVVDALDALTEREHDAAAIAGARCQVEELRRQLHEAVVGARDAAVHAKDA